MTQVNLQQYKRGSDEQGYALEALARVLVKYDKNAIKKATGKTNAELLSEFRKEHTKIEERNEEIDRELAYNFIQSEKSEGQKQWEHAWLDWVEKKNIETQ
jgi:hypothetical protein